MQGRGINPDPTFYSTHEVLRFHQPWGQQSQSHHTHGLNRRPHLPNPKSQSFSLSYGPNLPTSLTYIIPKTRGFEPWRPAAVMGTNRDENKNQTRLFMARHQRTRRSKTWTLCQLWIPIAGQTNSRDPPLLRRKENSSRGQCQGYQGCLRCRIISTFQYRNFNRSPFRVEGMFKTYSFQKVLSQHLGATYPCPTTVHMESFSTSVFKCRIWIIATTTKICTSGCFTQDYSKSFNANHRALLHIEMYVTVYSKE